MNQFAIRLLSLVLVAVLSQTGHALEADRDQAVQFQADGGSTMKFVDQLRVVEMSENVKITQGSLEILGEHAIIEFDANSSELERITVRGAPVSYKQELDTDGNTVTGSSETIEIYTDADTGETIVELIGNAEIRDAQSAWRCRAITYVVERELHAIKCRTLRRIVKQCNPMTDRPFSKRPAWRKVTRVGV